MYFNGVSLKTTEGQEGGKLETMGRSYLSTEKHTANQRMDPAVIWPVM